MQPLLFRVWIRHTGYVVGSRELRSSAYLCRDCGDREVAAALIWTGLLGWWSISSLVFRAPIATFRNWASAFRPPLRPLAWGAIPAAEFVRRLQEGGDLQAAYGSFDEAHEEGER